MKRDMGSEVLRSTGECGQPPLLKRLLPLLAALALAGCDVLEASPYPVVKSDLVVTDVNTQLNLPRFQWLNNHQLVVVAFDHEIPRPNNRAYLTESLVLWDTTTNTTTKIVEPDVGGLCLRNDQVKYFKRKTDPEGMIPRDSQQREHFVGPLGKGKRIDFQEPTDAMTCDSKKMQGGLPDWTKNIPNPEINIRRLRPEHGFIVIDRESPRHWPRSIKLYQHEKNAPIDLPRILEGDGPNPDTLGVYPKWYSHRQAYYLPALRSGSPSWWLMPSGELEIAWQIPDGGIKLPSKTMTRTAISVATEIPVIGASEYNIETIRESGLYALSDFNNPKRIVKGRIAQELEVSPDGCKVAFGNDDRPTIDPRKPMLFHKLQVINLCPEKTQ